MPITREEAIDEARNAADRAKRLAREAESAALSLDPNRRATGQQYAAAGAVWADASRAYSALAATLTEAASMSRTVVDKDRYFMNKAWHYRLTTQDKAGDKHKFPVLRGDYNACYLRSSYPHCTEAR